MIDIPLLNRLVEQFHANLSYYKDAQSNYNEHSCRNEYIDLFLRAFGWDVSNEKGLSPQYREVIAENYSTKTDRPDYSMTLRGVAKFFVEAKKPAVDILRDKEPAYQVRKYGWNANHRIAVLTNFEYLIIYDIMFTTKDWIENEKAGKRARLKNILLSYYNSISFAFTEICGRSYGGGVLEILPSEMGNILLPKIDGINAQQRAALLQKIDEIVRKDDNIENALDIVDQAVLVDFLGIDPAWCSQSRAIWRKLQRRRLARG